MRPIYKFFILFLFFKIFFINIALVVNAEETFDAWLLSYKKFALKKGISGPSSEMILITPPDALP